MAESAATQAKAALGGAEYACRVYAVDDRDVVVPLTNLPAPSAGAPEPVVLADENRAIVAYYAPDNFDWDTAKPEDLGDEEVAVLRFDAVHSFMFGAPNDEALHGHPLTDGDSSSTPHTEWSNPRGSASLS